MIQHTAIIIDGPAAPKRPYYISFTTNIISIAILNDSNFTNVVKPLINVDIAVSFVDTTTPFAVVVVIR